MLYVELIAKTGLLIDKAVIWKVDQTFDERLSLQLGFYS